MKNLKKVLSLVLVIAMAFSLVTIASAAKLDDYSDAASITEKEAVDVLSQAGVLQGAGGAFSPTDTFTREQAAKVVAYLMLGSKVADNLRTTKSSFTDVAATRWSAPYIEYCVSTGVINGMGDGTFNPEGKVTGTQFAKMLLTALGYGKNGEYVGPSWEINTLRDAVALEILDLDVDYTAPATREQVARYALNALTETAVVWTKDTDQYISKSGGANYFAEKLNLTFVDDVVSSGVSGHKWLLNDVEIGFYADEKVIATSSDGTMINWLTDKYGPFSAFFKAEVETDARYFYNGREALKPNLDGVAQQGEATVYTGAPFVWGGDIYIATADITPADTDLTVFPAKASTALSMKVGVIINFINTDKDNKAETVSFIEKEVAEAEGAPVVTGTSVKIPGLVNPAAGSAGLFNVEKIKYPADIEDGDYLLWYTDANGVTHVEKAQVVTGVATNSFIQGGATFYNFGSVSRKASGLDGADGAATVDAGMVFNAEVEMVLDDSGSIITVEAVEDVAATANYAVLVEAKTASANWTAGNIEAMLLFTDGNTKQVTLGKIGNSEATLSDAQNLEGQFVTYKVADNGKYNIKDATAGISTGPITSISMSRVASFMSGYTGDNTTVFLYDDPATPAKASHDVAADYKFAAVVGVAKAPVGTVSDVDAVVINGKVKYVFIENLQSATTAVSTENVAYIIYDGIFANYTIWPAKDDEPMYYEYKAIVDGQATTVKMLSPETYMLPSMSVVNGGLRKVVYDDDGYIVSTATPTYGVFGIGTAKPSNGVIVIGGVGYTYDSKTQVFYIDAFGNVTEKTVADIKKDSDDHVTVQYDANSYNNGGDLLEAIYIAVK